MESRSSWVQRGWHRRPRSGTDRKPPDDTSLRTTSEWAVCQQQILHITSLGHRNKAFGLVGDALKPERGKAPGPHRRALRPRCHHQDRPDSSRHSSARSGATASASGCSETRHTRSPPRPARRRRETSRIPRPGSSGPTRSAAALRSFREPTVRSARSSHHQLIRKTRPASNVQNRN